MGINRTKLSYYGPPCPAKKSKMTQPSTPQPLVDVQHVRKNFGPKTAVADVSLAVYPGEVFGLLGPNGAGKTTTIRMILNIFRPDAGQIAVLGGPMTQERSDRIGYMPEERGLYPDMRILDCLVYLGTLKGLTRATARQRALDFLEKLELQGQEKTKISALSRGMSQKVQVIAAVLHDPDLLIVDEPFANLDPVNAQLVRDVILDLRRRGKGIIMTSHQMSLVEALCDRIALIHQGVVQLTGTIAEVRRQFAKNMIRLTGSGQFPAGLTGVHTIEQLTTSDWQLFLEPHSDPHQVLGQLIQHAQGQFVLDRFEIAMPTLDEIFVQVVTGKN